jgi:hypothetical protein
MAKEIVSILSTNQFNDRMSQLKLKPGSTGRAVGIQHTNGETEIIIDREYYLNAGIPAEQLNAIVLHEKIELNAEGKDAHKLATVAEYAFVKMKYGVSGLQQYHARLSNLMGGVGHDDRKHALEVVLSGE